MKSIQKVIVQLLFFGIGFSSLAQSAKLRGIILDENKQAVAHVSVVCGAVGTQSNSNGFYELKIPANQKVTVVFTHISLKSASVVLFLKPNENFEFNPVMNTRQEQMGEVVVTAKNNKRIQGITSITPEVLRKIPGANAGVENILKTLAILIIEYILGSFDNRTKCILLDSMLVSNLHFPMYQILHHII